MSNNRSLHLYFNLFNKILDLERAMVMKILQKPGPPALFQCNNSVKSFLSITLDLF